MATQQQQKYILFSCPEMESLANNILNSFSEFVEKGNISWEVSNLQWSPLNWFSVEK